MNESIDETNVIIKIQSHVATHILLLYQSIRIPTNKDDDASEIQVNFINSTLLSSYGQMMGAEIH